jgi:peptide/nickel transport system permease protein
MPPPSSLNAAIVARRWLTWLRQNPAALIGGALLTAFAVLALFGPLLTPFGIDQRVGPVYGAPSPVHPLGLDDSGVDMLSLLIAGTRISMLVGFAASMVSVLVGGFVGVTAGYVGGWVDTALMRITDYFIVIPALPLMIVVATVWAPSVVHMVLIIALLLWTSTARLIRAQVLALKERVSVRRARAIGAGHARIVLRHIVPDIVGLLVATTVLAVSVAVFFEAALSFLGLGDPATSSGAWWAIIPPGLCIALVVLGSSLLGTAIQHAANPKAGIAHVSSRTFRIRPVPEASRD